MLSLLKIYMFHFAMEIIGLSGNLLLVIIITCKSVSEISDCDRILNETQMCDKFSNCVRFEFHGKLLLKSI
jgi:hypothetical protein